MSTTLNTLAERITFLENYTQEIAKAQFKTITSSNDFNQISMTLQAAIDDLDDRVTQLETHVAAIMTLLKMDQ